MRGFRLRGGFTLIETLVALVLVATAVLVGVGLAWQERMLSRQLAAQGEAQQAVGATIEGIRAGNAAYQPLSQYLGDYKLVPLPWPPEPDGAARGLAVWVKFEEGDYLNLFELSAEARYQIGEKVERRGLQTMYWAGNGGLSTP